MSGMARCLLPMLSKMNQTSHSVNFLSGLTYRQRVHRLYLPGGRFIRLYAVEYDGSVFQHFTDVFREVPWAHVTSGPYRPLGTVRRYKYLFTFKSKVGPLMMCEVITHDIRGKKYYQLEWSCRNVY